MQTKPVVHATTEQSVIFLAEPLEEQLYFFEVQLLELLKPVLLAVSLPRKNNDYFFGNVLIFFVEPAEGEEEVESVLLAEGSVREENKRPLWAQVGLLVFVHVGENSRVVFLGKLVELEKEVVFFLQRKLSKPLEIRPIVQHHDVFHLPLLLQLLTHRLTHCQNLVTRHSDPEDLQEIHHFGEKSELGLEDRVAEVVDVHYDLGVVDLLVDLQHWEEMEAGRVLDQDFLEISLPVFVEESDELDHFHQQSQEQVQQHWQTLQKLQDSRGK